MTGAIDERHVAHKHQVCIAALIGTLDVVSLRGTERCPALRCLTIRALVKFGIGVTQLDCNVTEFLAEMTNSLNSFRNMAVLTLVPETALTSVDLP